MSIFDFEKLEEAQRIAIIEDQGLSGHLGWAVAAPRKFPLVVESQPADPRTYTGRMHRNPSIMEKIGADP
ncbi:MAG TPA: hypothetical protein VKG22_03980 [Stellaceae bacterium]|nr:hypothetical protein [Stellaceae bacterium]HMD65792.1 hypothetical protein [Stellaceae bacterium]